MRNALCRFFPPVDLHLAVPKVLLHPDSQHPPHIPLHLPLSPLHSSTILRNCEQIIHPRSRFFFLSLLNCTNLQQSLSTTHWRSKQRHGCGHKQQQLRVLRSVHCRMPTSLFLILWLSSFPTHLVEARMVTCARYSRYHYISTDRYSLEHLDKFKEITMRLISDHDITALTAMVVEKSLQESTHNLCEVKGHRSTSDKPSLPASWQVLLSLPSCPPSSTPQTEASPQRLRAS